MISGRSWLDSALSSAHVAALMQAQVASGSALALHISPWEGEVVQVHVKTERMFKD